MKSTNIPLLIISISIAIGVLLGAYYLLVQLPAQEKAKESKEQERIENLTKCLSRNKADRVASHYARCGELERSPKQCLDVFSDKPDLLEAWELYDPEGSSIYSEFTEFTDSCNCGLSESDRDKLDKSKDEADSMCHIWFDK